MMRDGMGASLRLEAEFFRGALAGVEAPEVDGELAGDRDDGFLACGAGGLCAFGEDEESFADGRIGGLEADQSPGEFDERGAQAWIAVLGDGAWDPFGAAGVFARAEAGVAADLAAVAEAAPVADFAGDSHGGEFAQTGGE